MCFDRQIEVSHFKNKHSMAPKSIYFMRRNTKYTNSSSFLVETTLRKTQKYRRQSWCCISYANRQFSNIFRYSMMMSYHLNASSLSVSIEMCLESKNVGFVAIEIAQESSNLFVLQCGQLLFHTLCHSCIHTFYDYATLAQFTIFFVLP